MVRGNGSKDVIRMERTITVKANTVEEAIRLGAFILDVGLDEISTEILENPGRSLFGFRKSLAEVRVTTYEVAQSKKGSTTNMKSLADDVVLQNSKEKSASERVHQKELKKSGARIVKKKVEFSMGEGKYPVLIPAENVELFIDEKRVTEQRIIKPTDQVSVKVSDSLDPPIFTLRVSDREMSVLLSFIPGKRIYRKLVDTDFLEVLKIEAKEEVVYYNDIRPQQIIEALKEIGVQQGYVFQAIQSITEAHEEREEIVARGVQPTEGLDGDFILHIEDEDEADELEAVDFREFNQFATVSEGDVIGTRILAQEGIDGVNVFGKVVPARKVKDISIRLGKNVELIGDDVVAQIAGRPEVDWQSKYVKIDVLHELIHRGEVNLASGNIRFDGDVRIQGNIHPSMFVGSTGSIIIDGTITKAMIQAAKNVIVKKNVFSTTITVGEQDVVLEELVGNLKGIKTYLVQIHRAIYQIKLIHEKENEKLTPVELNHLIHLLLESKYAAFKMVVEDLIQKVKNHSLNLPEEWRDLADRFYRIFLSRSTEIKQSDVALDLLIQEASELIEIYEVKRASHSSLSLPYAINSVLYCSGNIHITRQGLYQCFVTAKQNIIVNGILRGGEINAGNLVRIDESGAENIVKTVIRTRDTGHIRIGIAYEGTEIYIGNRKHAMTKRETNVHAYQDNTGNLIINY